MPTGQIARLVSSNAPVGRLMLVSAVAPAGFEGWRSVGAEGSVVEAWRTAAPVMTTAAVSDYDCNSERS